VIPQTDSRDRRRLSVAGCAGLGCAQGSGISDLEPHDPPAPKAHHPALWMGSAVSLGSSVMCLLSLMMVFGGLVTRPSLPCELPAA